MNRTLLKQARDALLASRCYVDVEGSDAELDVHLDAIAALDAELAKPEGCLSNCDTCTYAWGSPANPWHCFMFFEEPQGVCQNTLSLVKLATARATPTHHTARMG